MSGRLEGIRRGEWTLSLRFSPLFDADEDNFSDQTGEKSAKPRKNKPINLTVLSEDEEKLPPLIAGAIYAGEDWEALLSLHAKADALRRALECLSRGDLSRRALYARLRQKGVGDAEARFAVGRVVALGDLREGDQLRRLCLSLSEKGKGPRVILAKAATAGDKAIAAPMRNVSCGRWKKKERSTSPPWQEPLPLRGQTTDFRVPRSCTNSMPPVLTCRGRSEARPDGRSERRQRSSLTGVIRLSGMPPPCRRKTASLPFLFALCFCVPAVAFSPSALLLLFDAP